jgi:hypothetical protein
MARALKNWRRRRGVSDSKTGDGYEVGYRKPPKGTQFQKGRSGNPSGRPKGSLNLATVVERTLRERVVVQENGRRKTITKMQAWVKQLVYQASSGNVSAMRLLTTLVASVDFGTREAGSEGPSLHEADQKVLAEMIKELKQAEQGE